VSSASFYQMESVSRIPKEAEAETRGGLGDLYVRHAREARGLAYLLTGDHGLAEDLAQEAFARVAGRLMHLRDPDAFPAYLRKTVVNLAHSHARRQRVERAYLRQEQGSRTEEEGVEYDLDIREDLWRALLRLPVRQRVAVVIHYYRDVSESEASAILRCRPGTYRSLVARGMRSLREQMVGELNAQ
jgi:RNA polymerase sigma factor (sigma-70 family)